MSHIAQHITHTSHMQYAAFIGLKLLTKQQCSTHTHTHTQTHGTHRWRYDLQSSEALGAHLVCSRVPTHSIAAVCEGASSAMVSSMRCGQLRIEEDHHVAPLQICAMQTSETGAKSQKVDATSCKQCNWKATENVVAMQPVSQGAAKIAARANLQQLALLPSMGFLSR